MDMDSPIPIAVHHFLAANQRNFILAALKGLRNGVVYGARIRAPHALVMTFLFGRGTLWEKLLAILKLTRTHAFNLARFVGAYKLTTGLLQSTIGGGKPSQWHSFVAAFCIGHQVFGENNGVNMQINLYLLSRIMVGGARLAVEKGYIRRPPGQVFPWFAAIVWGVVLWMFEWHKPVLQPSLQSSMTYLYHDSNFWTGLGDFLFVNKLE